MWGCWPWWVALLGFFCVEYFLTLSGVLSSSRALLFPIFPRMMCNCRMDGGRVKYEAFTGKLHFLEERKPLAKQRDEERFNFAVSIFRKAVLSWAVFHYTLSQESQGQLDRPTAAFID